MKKNYPGGWIAVAVNLSIIIALGAGQVFASSPANPAVPGGRISAEIYQKLNTIVPGERLAVIVILASQTDPRSLAASLKTVPAGRRSAELETVLQAKTARDQAGLLSRLAQLEVQGQVDKIVPFWIFNGISVTAPSEVIQELAARPEVASIVPDKEYQIQPDSSAIFSPTLPAANTNISLINAPALWKLGFTGQGVVVANLDTGVDATHPDLASRYRGGKKSWFDPYGQHSTPTDMAGSATGHGTATMSLMVGGNASGNDIGVAPGAQWIAAKVFNDKGTATTTAIHQAFQWVLNPNKSASNPGAPQVVSSSWGNLSTGCDLSFQPDIQALLAAGILPVFSAGNFGPGVSTGTSPANFPEAFAVGAISNSSFVAGFSSRGPDPCGRTAPAVFPMVVAPGVNILVAAPSGKYAAYNGTSFSAPETAGVLALLLSAFPNLSSAAQAKALISTAVDLGAIVGPDNDYGYGRIDALAAYNSLKNPGFPTSTATPRSSPAGSSLSGRVFLPVVNH